MKLNVAAQIMEDSLLAILWPERIKVLAKQMARPYSIRWTILTVVCGSGDYIDTASKLFFLRETVYADERLSTGQW
jgi:hypothetical protein